jgi:hypothetical protein
MSAVLGPKTLKAAGLGYFWLYDLKGHFC